MAAEAVQGEFDGAKADPFPAAEDSGGAGDGSGGAGDGDLDEATEVAPVRAFIDVDEDGEGVAGAGLAGEVFGGGGGDIGVVSVLVGEAGEAGGAEEFLTITGGDAAAHDVPAALVGDQAGGDDAGGEGFRHRERAAFLHQGGEHHAFEGLVVLGDNEVADAALHFGLHRGELGLDVIGIRAAGGELDFDLRVVGAEAELHGAIGCQVFDAFEDLVDMGFAEPGAVEPLERAARRG